MARQATVAEQSIVEAMLTAGDDEQEAEIVAEIAEATDTPVEEVEEDLEERKERARHYRRVGQYSVSIHDSVGADIPVPTVAQLFYKWATDHNLMLDIRYGDAVVGLKLMTPEAYAAKVAPQNGVSLKRTEAKAIKGALELAMERGISRDDFMAALKLALDNGTILPQNVAPKNQKQV